jgi:phage shock protein C
MRHTVEGSWHRPCISDEMEVRCPRHELAACILSPPFRIPSPWNFFLPFFVYTFRIQSTPLCGGNFMLCPSCQKDIAPGSKFCYSCGAKQPDAPGAPSAPPSYIPPKKLVRSINNKKIAGVCAGVADYFDIDPTLVRVLWLLATLIPGPNIIVYVILWIVLPQGPTAVASTSPGNVARV